MIRVGVDANGGDQGVNVTVLAAMQAVSENKELEVVLFGDENKIKPLLTNSERISIVHTDKTMEMGEENPMIAVRKNPDASLCMVMKAAKDNEVDAVVTSGPTQGVVMAAHMIVRKLKEMDRVALCPIIPNYDGKARLILDVGANVELRPEHFGEFAIFATVAAKEVFGIDNPKVGYLNIGSEPGKGRQLDKEAYQYLSELEGINFYGNVEGDQIIDAPVDIILCEGYGGNICIKTLEGTAKGMGKMLKEEIKSSLGGKIGYLFMRKNLKRFAARMDAKKVGGAMIFGISKPVVKAHGNSDSDVFCGAIHQAARMVKSDIINKVIAKLPKKESKDE